MGTNEEDAPVDPRIDALAELPVEGPGSRADARILASAHSALRRQKTLRDRPWLGRASRAWDRFVEPALVVGVSATYLAWAVLAVRSVLGP